MDVTAQLRAAARERFGWEELRPEQETAMRALMAGRDALVVAPTGGGKSAIYQVPATLLAGPTVVVSPLLALQHDQIAGLADRDDAALAAVRLSSAESASAQRAAVEALHSGRVEYVFVTPEQLADPEKLAAIREARPSLVAVDEAHCISAWGYDFRPDYLQLGRAVRDLGHPPVVALTATASPPVREDILSRLGMRDPEVVISDLDRPNILLEAVQCVDEEQRRQRLLGRLRESQPPGIVYVSTRRAAEELAAWLTDTGIEAAAYHGGMSARERTRRHEAFLADEVPVMVATSAFGMGIDKPNIRWVNHVSLPDSPDSYFQEIGRAGRDGEPAQALLLFRTEDTGLRKFFTGGIPAVDGLSRLAEALRIGPATRTALREKTGLGPRKLGEHLSLLEEVGAAVAGRGGKWRAAAYAPGPAEAAEAAVEQAERRQTVQRSRLDMMRNLAETLSCRGQALLAYFGQHLDQPCGHCDNCLSGAADEVEAARDEGPYPVNGRVAHPEWGDGTVLRYSGDQMTVLFDDLGYKTLSVPVVEEQGLLTELG
ncbi:RecQ family ATP-dependent DNA helicase [Planosporangium mesophilum]|uniref:ATP-dependent DNA helicase RecQ n=1 Tax=Planosporangium mesophilum TaxID=689768 RepID=A0A8J3T9M7_9ACTN|nr:RecQ family ATP-dependent DNA helicase [Planosporangium mesophilum]NJC82650.1 ATP-dependent DNA helicase RecQ [Planosporangium mesophilum]GII21797.1 ATP-dependent DNA helicase RecQ [Planosporangium mesophilum]